METDLVQLTICPVFVLCMTLVTKVYLLQKAISPAVLAWKKYYYMNLYVKANQADKDHREDNKNTS